LKSEDLQERIDQEIPLAKHIGIVVESADDTTVVLRAPLAPNGNHKGTAFGGSLYSVAVLSGEFRPPPPGVEGVVDLPPCGIVADLVADEHTHIERLCRPSHRSQREP